MMIRMICLTTGRARFYNQSDHMQIPFKLVANLWKASKSEISQNRNTIALSLKDIEPGLKSSIESFRFIKLLSVAGWVIILTHPSVLQELDFIIYTRGGGSWYFRPRSRGGSENFTPIAGMGHLISAPKFNFPTPPPNFWQLPNRRTL